MIHDRHIELRFGSHFAASAVSSRGCVRTSVSVPRPTSRRTSSFQEAASGRRSASGIVRRTCRAPWRSISQRRAVRPPAPPRQGHAACRSGRSVHDGPFEEVPAVDHRGRTPRRRRRSSARPPARPAAADGWSPRPRSRPPGGVRARRPRRCPCRRRWVRPVPRGASARLSHAGSGHGWRTRLERRHLLAPSPRTRRLSAMPSRSITWRARTLPSPGIDCEQVDRPSSCR